MPKEGSVHMNNILGRHSIRGEVVNFFEVLGYWKRQFGLECYKRVQGIKRCYISYSQAGEDLIVHALFRSFGVDKITYLDIGANHPDYLSNTFLFYKTGSRGVTIEPNPRLYMKHRKLRPLDNCLNVGIGINDDKNATFYLFGWFADGLSTFSKEDADCWEREGINGVGRCRIEKTAIISLRKINDIIAETGIPDFLSIDIEGLDFAVIKTLDFSKYRIKCFCVESVCPAGQKKDTQAAEIVKFFKMNSYIVYADTGINTIFVDAIWFANLLSQK